MVRQQASTESHAVHRLGAGPAVSCRCVHLNIYISASRPLISMFAECQGWRCQSRCHWRCTTSFQTTRLSSTGEQIRFRFAILLLHLPTGGRKALKTFTRLRSGGWPDVQTWFKSSVRTDDGPCRFILCSTITSWVLIAIIAISGGLGVTGGLTGGPAGADNNGPVGQSGTGAGGASGGGAGGVGIGASMQHGLLLPPLCTGHANCGQAWRRIMAAPA